MRQRSDQRFRIVRVALASDGEDAAMDMEAGDGVHDGLRRRIDRHRGGRETQRVGEARQPVLQHQHRFRLETRGGEEHVQHDLALGDETAMPTGEVAFADGQVGRDARIGGIVDADDFHAQDRRGFQRASSTELATTDTEENAIAAPASIGDSKPVAASGMPIRL